MSDDLLYMSLDELPDEDVLGRPPAWPNGLFRFTVSSIRDDWTDPTENTPEEHMRVKVGFAYSGEMEDFENRRFGQTYILPNYGDPKSHWTRDNLVDLMRLVRACGLSGWDPKNFAPEDETEEAKERAWDEAREALVELAKETQDLECVLHITRYVPDKKEKRERYGDGEGYVNRVRKYWTTDAEEVLS